MGRQVTFGQSTPTWGAAVRASLFELVLALICIFGFSMLPRDGQVFLAAFTIAWVVQIMRYNTKID